MKTGKVIGNIWATRKEERLSGMKLLIVQPFYPAADFVRKAAVPIQTDIPVRENGSGTADRCSGF